MTLYARMHGLSKEVESDPDGHFLSRSSLLQACDLALLLGTLQSSQPQAFGEMSFNHDREMTSQPFGGPGTEGYESQPDIDEGRLGRSLGNAFDG